MRSAQDPASGDADRRLFNRYATGLDAELVSALGIWNGQLVDLSIGGACILVGADAAAELKVGQELLLRAPMFGAGDAMPAFVRRTDADRVHVAFAGNEEAEHRLALFLLGNAAGPP